MFKLFSNPLKEGVDIMLKGSYPVAIKHFEGLIKKRKHIPESLYNIGKCYFKMSDYFSTKSYFHKAVESNPSDDVIEGILEITNWNMISSNSYYNANPSFSYDGRMIAYVSARRDTNNDGRINIMDRAGVYVANVLTGEEKYLVSDDYFNFSPKFSPGGSKLSYLSVRKGDNYRANPGLYLLDIETGIEEELLGENYLTKYHAFSPCGTKIIFSCWLPGDKNCGIYFMDMHSKKIETFVPGYYENTYPSMSGDGKKVVYSSWRRDTNKDGNIDMRDNSGIYIKYLDTNTEYVVAEDRYNNSFPSFSPDANRILYNSVRRDTNKDGIINSLDNPGIYIYDINRDREYCIVNDKYFNKFPSFADAGKKIVFLSNWRRPKNEEEDIKDYFEQKGVYTVDIANRKIRQVVSDKYYGSRFPAASYRGDMVAYVSWRKTTNRGLYVAYLNRFPTAKELHTFIDKNF